MRFLHLADVHLDTPFAGRTKDVRRLLRQASRDAFRSAVNLVLEEGLDALLIAGDLFDGEHLSFATERILLEELGRLASAGIQTVYATGNHDPGDPARRALALPWPEGVTVVSGPDPVQTTIRSRDGGAIGTVTAAGHATSAETRDLAASFPRPSGSGPHIALLHTQVVGSRGEDGHDPYAPAALETLEASRYDYWALGHIHIRQQVSDDPVIWYPGNVQGRHPGESGPKGGLVVDAAEGVTPRVEFRALAPIRWERLAVDDLGAASTLEELERILESRWNEERRADAGLPGGDWILRVAMSGPTSLHDLLRQADERATLEEELRARLGVLDVEVRTEGVHAPVDPDAHRERQDSLGEALRMLDAVDSDDELLDRVRPDSLAGLPPDGDPRAYLRSLLEGLDAELVIRMLEPSGEREP